MLDALDPAFHTELNRPVQKLHHTALVDLVADGGELSLHDLLVDIDDACVVSFQAQVRGTTSGRRRPQSSGEAIIAQATSVDYVAGKSGIRALFFSKVMHRAPAKITRVRDNFSKGLRHGDMAITVHRACLHGQHVLVELSPILGKTFGGHSASTLLWSLPASPHLVLRKSLYEWHVEPTTQILHMTSNIFVDDDAQKDIARRILSRMAEADAVDMDVASVLLDGEPCEFFDVRADDPDASAMRDCLRSLKQHGIVREGATGGWLMTHEGRTATQASNSLTGKVSCE
mmetsp:Transcript_99233/g.319811  ORF Transcript_99233/g.319811 Transcript_99233/m.319811 type:complete len:287 (+) Transcript_99233:1336-2196(+)